MRARILDIKINLRQPWLLCVLLIAVIPLFPEYISPFLAVGALIAAHFDAKARRRDFVVGGLGNAGPGYGAAYMVLGVLALIGTIIMFTVDDSLVGRDR